jgi:hypothetical protein
MTEGANFLDVVWAFVAPKVELNDYVPQGRERGSIAHHLI